MRLVSVFYEEYHPFDTFDLFKSFITTNDPKELKRGDVIVVHGGADIHPSLYGKSRSKQSGAYEYPSHRDIVEWNMMQAARELDIPIIGICRGAQMLCALAGGYLYQHVNGHGGMHLVQAKDKKEYYTNSLHHQMMAIAPTEHELLAWTQHNSTEYWDEDVKAQPDKFIEPEFVYFPKVKGFAIQWHPEMMPANIPATEHIKQILLQKLN